MKTLPVAKQTSASGENVANMYQPLTILSDDEKMMKETGIVCHINGHWSLQIRY